VNAPVHIHDMQTTLMHLSGINHDAQDYSERIRERMPNRRQALLDAMGLGNVHPDS
jgi:hypothetical protein